MGCDIHSFAEVKRNGKWEEVKEAFTLDEFDKKYYKKEKGDEPFGWRSYGLFAFLAGVRNYSHCECITGEPRGLPDDSEFLNTLLDEPENFSYGGYDHGTATTKKEYYTKDADYHSHSYITLKEFLDWDYDKIFWDRRVTKQTSHNSWNGASLAEEGEGQMITYREHLGNFFFTHLEDLKALGEPEDVRIIFWFDN